MILNPDQLRQLRKARVVLVCVSGTDDVYWARLSKPEGRRLVEDADGQLTMWLDDDGDLRIDRRTT